MLPPHSNVPWPANMLSTSNATNIQQRWSTTHTCHYRHPPLSLTNGRRRRKRTTLGSSCRGRGRRRRLCFRQPTTNVNPTTTTTTNNDDNDVNDEQFADGGSVAVPLKLYHFLSVFALQNGIRISHKPALKRDVSPWATLHI